MNKASVHCTQPGNMAGLGDLLRNTAQAGKVIPVVYAVNVNLRDTLAQNSPTTRYVYRRQTDTFNRLPPNFYNDDPVTNATNWLTVTRDPADQNRTLIQNWALNPADCYDPLNEPVIGLPPNYTQADLQDAIRKAQYLNTWMITALDIAAAQGMKLALFSFPTGSPPMEIWPYLYPALRKGKSLGAILSLHEYSVNNSMKIADSGNVLRYRCVYSSLPLDCRIPIIVSECGAGNGYDTGLAGQAWVDDLMWYNAQACQDSYLLGFCAFQLGGNESNMVNTLPAYTTAIANFSCPVVTPPTAATESPDGTTVPPAAKIVDSQKNVWTLGAAVPMGYVILKNGVQFAGGQGNLLLYYSKKVYTRNASNDWFVANGSWTKVPGDPRVVLRDGIDVSLYQGAINWTTVKPNISYAFIKATQGSTIVDPQFANNWAQAKANGIPRGAYHYFKFMDNPQAQADLFINTLKGDYGELPPVVDVEDTSYAASINNLKTFIDIVGQKTGRRCMIYTAKWFWNASRWGGPVTWAKDYDLWTASYTTAPIVPDDWFVNNVALWRFWQYTSSGAVGGITGNVDMDKFNGDYNAFQYYLDHLPPAATTPPTPTQIKFGLGYGTQNELPQSHADLYGSAFGTDANASFKFLTLPDSALMVSAVQKIKSKNPGAALLARIFFSVGNTPFTPQNFVDFSANGTSAAYGQGILDFEVHNEPNLSQESAGTWTNGVGFGNWLKSTLQLLRSRYPNARFWFPGLSPNDAAPQFIADALSTGVGPMLYGYCFHSYWYSETGGTWNMVDETGGFSWKKLWRMLPPAEQAKPTWVSEFSNNSAAVPPYTKGQQYKKYRTLLSQNGVKYASSFVLYWDGDPNHENWANLNGGSTGIKEGYTA